MTAAAYQTPGVYYQTVDASSAAITGVRTDIAGFVGIALRGPIDVPVPVESWRQFEAHFGGCIGGGYLAYAVRAFFENGGRRCWVTRIASLDSATGARSASAEWSSATNPVWHVAASSPGRWGNALSVRCIQTHRAQTVAYPQRSTPQYSAVETTSGFTRGSLVRITQHAGSPARYKVVSDVDPIQRRLVWMQDRPGRRLPYDAPLMDLDPNEPFRIESVEYTLAVTENGRPVAVYEELSTIPEHPRYGPSMLGELLFDSSNFNQGIPSAPPRITLRELREHYGAAPNTPRPTLVTVLEADLPTAATLALEGGRDGLSQLSVYDFVGEDASPEESDMVQRAKRRGLRALGKVQEVAMVAIPDIHIQPIAPPEFAPLPRCEPNPCLPHTPQEPVVTRHLGPVELPPVFSEAQIHQVQAELVQHCEDLRDRIAILDAPYDTAKADSLGSDLLGIAAIRAWRTRFDSKYAALYYPWAHVVDPLRGAGTRTRAIPPSGHIAGQYAKTDIDTGVHRAPANGMLSWIQDVTVQTSADVHGQLNMLGINVLRPLTGRGIRILGARLVSSDPDWRFVNVRRLMMMIEKALDLSTQWAVFEPNDHFTRTKIQLAISTYLSTLWQQGALAGASTDEAFFVKCDEENNPPDQRANGRMTVDIGVAPAQPFEFIVLRVWRAGNELEVAQLASTGRTR